jgi:hypothetical protein
LNIKSYAADCPDYRYLFEGDNPIPVEKITKRFKDRLEMLQKLIQDYKLDNECSVNPGLLETAVMDYFADIKRLKDFHGSEHIQYDKIYAYESYWLLRNHPIQLKAECALEDDKLHINEFIISYMYIRLLATELEYRVEADIQVDNLVRKLEHSEFTIELRRKLYYAFRYCTFTAQTILFAFESYLAAAQFTLQVT